MPLYEYGCRTPDCPAWWEISQPFSDDAIAECPWCGYNTAYRIFSIGYIKTSSSSDTLGGIAEKNTKNMGGSVGEKIQHMANERKAEFKGKLPEGAKVAAYQEGRPWWRQDRSSPDMSLTRMTPEQTTKYVMEGKKPL